LIECSQEPASGNDQASATSAGPRSFEQIMRRYASLVFRVCYNVTRNAHDAEDAAQAVFLTLHKQMKSGEPIEHLAGWLQQVAYRVSLDFQRGKKRRLAREEIYTANEQKQQINGDAAVELQESRLLVAEELDRLPAKYRLPLILHYFGGLSHEEMAREMRCRPGTLRVRLHRARRVLGERLTRRGVAMPAILLNHTLEQMIFRHVTDGIMAAARHGQIAWRIGGVGQQAGEICRTALSVKAKVAVFVAALTASASTIAITQAFGSAIENLPRTLEDKIDQVIRAAARPIMKTVLPPIQASAAPTPAIVAPSKIAPLAEPVVARAESTEPVWLPEITTWHLGTEQPIRMVDAVAESNPRIEDMFLASVAPAAEIGSTPRLAAIPGSVNHLTGRHDVSVTKPTPAASPMRTVAETTAPVVAVDVNPAPSDSSPVADITTVASPPSDFVAGGTMAMTFSQPTGASVSTVTPDGGVSFAISTTGLVPDDAFSTSPISVSGGAAMPEPSGLVFLGLGALLLKRRRRRERP
jgi:RNA polymerase sigma factor (sigma-70 family)